MANRDLTYTELTKKRRDLMSEIISIDEEIDCILKTIPNRTRAGSNYISTIKPQHSFLSKLWQTIKI
jgi:peptidoglycan hydrolase CwlO-like protein